jgi:GT2 family glycosyltransferase/glycosyltransferase involved in cell wall biosynthesis
MAEKSKISVILTSYNHAKYLREAIDSVLHQTYSDFELIIWDDASTDESWEIISNYSDPRIRSFRNETNQRGGNINRALSQVIDGHYIAIQHSDDVWEPQKLEKQVTFLDENPQIGAVFTNAFIINEDGLQFEDEKHFYYRIFDQQNRSRHEWLNYFFYQGNALCHPSILIRRKCYDDCGIYRYGLAHITDFDMWVRLCLKYDIHVLPEKLVRFRVRANEMNSSGNRPETRIQSQFEALELYGNFRDINTSEEFIKVFPAAKEYFKPDGFEVDFALGMMALQAKPLNPVKLFGLMLLFETLNDPGRQRKVNELYGFGHKDFIALTSTYDVFSVESVSKLTNQLQVLSSQVQTLSSQVDDQRQLAQSLNTTLHQIYASRSWRLIQFAQRMRIFFFPYNSLRERIARKILAGLRKLRLFGREAFGKLIKGIGRSGLAKLFKAWYGNIKLRSLARKIGSLHKNPALQSPTASIIIPVHNQIDQTLNCLLSLASSQDQTDYEVIIMDDASTDKTPEFLRNIKGIRYIRNTTNIGFLRSCNEAAQKAKGEYLVFLNNDTRVHRHWLDNLLATFSLAPNTGLVGSKLIFPNGKLQEAGGIIWADGSARNYGRNDDPHNYKYNYVREADYVSGASIMLPRVLWERLGGFDKQYQPAYYEDVDLAFKVRRAGYKVVYQPFSQLTHYEGASNGVDLNNGTKRYQVINQQKFFNNWQGIIASHGLPAQIPGEVRSNRSAKGHILFIDDGTPKPDRYAGAVLSEFYMITLSESGYAVTFLPHIDRRYADRYTQALQKKGVECLYQPYISSSEQYIMQNGYLFDYVIMSRANVASEVIDLVKEFAPNARTIFNTIDLHFLRFDRAAQISLRAEDIEIARQAKETELGIIHKVDCTLVVSDTEQQLLNQLVPHSKVKVVPFPADLREPEKRFEERRDIVFLGGFMHKPNVDAVLFFAKDIWPLIAKAIPEGRFVIAGADATKKIRQLESSSILVKGFIDDLEKLFATAKLSVAPLRFGAGIKGKVLASLGYGVPCVATTIACEGIGLRHGKNILVADSPEEYAKAVINLYTSANLWTALSKEGQAWIRQNYSRPVVASKLLDVFKEL